MESLFYEIIDLWRAFHLGTALFLFFLYIVIDMLYARYTLEVTALRPVRAANVATFIYLFLAVGVLNYTANPLYVGPMVLGSWVGTYVTVEWERRKVKEEESDEMEEESDD
jgi:heme A synthase